MMNKVVYRLQKRLRLSACDVGDDPEDGHRVGDYSDWYDHIGRELPEELAVRYYDKVTALPDSWQYRLVRREITETIDRVSPEPAVDD